MPKIYTDGNPSYIAYLIDGGISGYTETPGRPNTTSMGAEYLAIVYGLNEFFLKWNEVLDERVQDLDAERFRATGETEFYNVPRPIATTKQRKPPPILVCSDNEVVVGQLTRQYHIASPELRKLAQQVWKMTENLEVKFQWIPRKENLAGKMLP